MGKLINTTSMTVDGLVDVGEWYVGEGDHDAPALAQFDGGAALVTGYTTYEGLAGFWTQQTGTWADKLNPLPKFVASRKERGPLEWNAQLIEGDPADGLRRLKEEREGDLILTGCGELASYLLDKGVIDELRFWIHPAIGGEGTRPYGDKKVPMWLIGSTAYDSGVTLLRYEPTSA